MPNHVSPTNLQKFWGKIKAWIESNFYKKTDVYNSAEIDEKLNEKVESLDLYTKSDIDAKLSEKANLSDVYGKSYVDTQISNKALSSDVYTKTQVDNKLATKVSIPSNESYSNLPIGTYIASNLGTVSGTTTKLWYYSPSSSPTQIKLSDSQPASYYVQSSGVWAIRSGLSSDDRPVFALAQRIS